MRHAPPVAIELKRSRPYLGIAGVITIIIVAIYAYPIWALGVVDLKLSAHAGLLHAIAIGSAAMALTWLWRDSLRQPQVQSIRYALGEWTAVINGQAQRGAVQVQWDLQVYILVRWTAGPRVADGQLSPVYWMHIDRSMAASRTQWQALRRALFAPSMHATDRTIDPATAGPVESAIT